MDDLLKLSCTYSWRYLKNLQNRDLQDGGGVRHGDHLPPHKYIRNTSTW